MRRLLLALTLPLVAACATYEPTPLDQSALLEELRSVTVEVPSDGLEVEQAVALALVQHPDLHVVRRDQEIAAGLVVSARAWDNPDLRPRLQNIYSGARDSIQWALDLRVFPRAPGETAAREARAQAREQHALAIIEETESRIAVETRIAHAQLVALDTQIGIVRAAEQLHSRVATIVTEQVEAQVSTRIEAVLVELAQEELADESASLVAQRAIAEAHLASLIGAPPDATLAVRRAARGQSVAIPSQAELEEQAVAAHPALRALAAAYEDQEQRLRLTHIAHSPWPNFLAIAGGGDAGDAVVDADASLTLPVFHSGEHDIAVAEARRDRARDAYRARLHAVRGEIRRASLALREHERRHNALSRRLGPLLDRAEQLVRSVLDAGGANPLALLAIEMRVLDLRRDTAQAAFERDRARAELAAATGSALAAE